MVGIIGKKIGMTRIYDSENRSLSCTIIEGGPCVVTQIKTVDSDGYNAVQFGYGEKKEKNSSKPEMGHLKKSGVSPKRTLFELKDFIEDYEKDIKLGSAITIEEIFEEGDFVDVVGTSKGKGFQGVVKRHNFKGVGDSTHGQHNRQRAPGSIGGASYPARVFKGMRMAGRTGGERVKVDNLKILKIMPDRNIILVNGAIPGARNGLVILQK